MKAIDFFCGGGGMTCGAEQAGVRTVFVANHWSVAVESHRLNHPHAQHIVQDLMLYDFSQIPEHDIFLASPSCQGFSNARGRDRKHHDALRATMWCVVSCSEVWRQPVVILENVPEVLNWELYPAWKLAMEALSYHVQPFIIDAADYGVPQNRVRTFILCSQEKKEVNLPDPVCHTSVRPYIDWEYKRWTRVDKPGRSAKVLEQIARARRELRDDRFLIPYYGSGSGLTGRSLDRPCGTLIAQDVWAVVDGDRMRMLQPHEYKRIMGFPENYTLKGTRRDQVRMYGNAVCPPAMKVFIESVLAA